jgi:hypothetical protein
MCLHSCVSDFNEMGDTHVCVSLYNQIGDVHSFGRISDYSLEKNRTNAT